MGSVESTPSKEKERDEGKVLMVYDVKKGGGHVDRREAMKRFRCERLALREIGEEVEKGLNVAIREYTFENHMFDDARLDFFEDEYDTRKKLRKTYDLMIMMQHDWPTVRFY